MTHTTPVGKMWQHTTIKRWILMPLEYNQPYAADLAHQFTISWGNNYHMQENCTYTQPLKWPLLHVTYASQLPPWLVFTSSESLLVRNLCSQDRPKLFISSLKPFYQVFARCNLQLVTFPSIVTQQCNSINKTTTMYYKIPHNNK